MKGGVGERDLPGATDVFRAAAALPLAARAHLAVRRWTAPWDRILASCGRGDSLLDVGCGPGLLAHLLSHRGFAGTYSGVDPDGRKVGRARAWVGETPRRTFRAGSVEAAEGTAFDEAVIVDVLYLVRRAERARFVADVVARLGPSGRLLVLTSGGGPRWKRAVDRAQERVAVGLVGLTQGEAVEPCDGAEVAALLAAAGLSDVRVEDAGAGYLHGFELVSGRRGASPTAR